MAAKAASESVASLAAYGASVWAASTALRRVAVVAVVVGPDAVPSPRPRYGATALVARKRIFAVASCEAVGGAAAGGRASVLA